MVVAGNAFLLATTDLAADLMVKDDLKEAMMSSTKNWMMCLALNLFVSIHEGVFRIATSQSKLACSPEIHLGLCRFARHG